MLPHRDYIVIKKIVREMNIGVEMLDFTWFVSDRITRKLFESSRAR